MQQLGGSDSKESACQCRKPMFDSWVEKIPWRKKCQPTLVFLPGKSHGQRSLVGYSPQDCKESDMTEQVTHKRTVDISICYTERVAYIADTYIYIVYIQQFISAIERETNNENQLYSTGNYSQYFIITYKGKEPEKGYIHVHIYV